jgi:hypothetical protein
LRQEDSISRSAWAAGDSVSKNNSHLPKIGSKREVKIW